MWLKTQIRKKLQVLIPLEWIDLGMIILETHNTRTFYSLWKVKQTQINYNSKRETLVSFLFAVVLNAGIA